MFKHLLFSSTIFGMTGWGSYFLGDGFKHVKSHQSIMVHHWRMSSLQWGQTGNLTLDAVNCANWSFISVSSLHISPTRATLFFLGELSSIGMHLQLPAVATQEYPLYLPKDHITSKWPLSIRFPSSEPSNHCIPTICGFHFVHPWVNLENMEVSWSIYINILTWGW